MARTKHLGIQFNNEEQARVVKKLLAVNSILTERANISGILGQTYNGDRKLYETLGYKKTLEYSDFSAKYLRQDVASRIVNAFPDATWRGEPIVTDQEKRDPENLSEFEKTWNEIATKFDVYQYLTRIDKLASIGRYSVLFIGLGDGESDLSKPVQVKNKMELLYLQPFSERSAVIKTWDNNPTSPRYGLPETYDLAVQNVSNSNTAQSTNRTVHHSRVIHVADGLLESNVYGTPKLENIFNRLDNLELIAGGSAEMFWRGAYSGLALEMDAGATVEDADALNDEIEEYVHNLRRVIRLQGMKANQLAPTISSPKDHFQVQLQLISSASGIPIRILTGSERGELASTQDDKNWNDRVSERRNDFAEPQILRPFIDILIQVGVLPKPTNIASSLEVNILWPEIDFLTAKAKADIGDIRTKALKAYVESGASGLIDPFQFFTKFLGFEDEVAKELEESVLAGLEEERKQSQIEEEALEEERRRAAEEEARRVEDD